MCGEGGAGLAHGCPPRLPGRACLCPGRHDARGGAASSPGLCCPGRGVRPLNTSSPPRGHRPP